MNSETAKAIELADRLEAMNKRPAKREVNRDRREANRKATNRKQYHAT